MLEISLLSLISLVAHLWLRRRPVKALNKIGQSIEVYWALDRQLRGLQQRETGSIGADGSESIDHFERRKHALSLFIQERMSEYEKLYNDRYKRLILRLPPPKTFEP